MSAILLAADVRFEAAAMAVEGAQDMGALRSAVQAMLKPYGLRHAVYHAIKIPGANVQQDVIIFTYSNEWVSHYLAKRYYEIDPVIQLGKVSLLPLDWTHIDKSKPTVRNLFGEAEDAGIGRQGLTIPLRGLTGDEAMFTITSDMSCGEWNVLKRTICRDMQVIAHYVHARVTSLYVQRKPDITHQLNRREKEVLKWAACGKTVPETSIILNLSMSTIRVYLDSARHKLDCVSKPQAVAKAMRLGLISD